LSAETNSSVDQVFDVLEVLGRSDEPVGVAELARTLSVPTSTAHRVLLTLHQADYAARDTTGTKYQLGVAAQELVHAFLRRLPIQAPSQPFLRRLAAETGDTVLLTSRVGWYSVRIAGIEGWGEIHAAPRLGQSALLELTPGGLGILAFLEADLPDRYLRWRSGELGRAGIRQLRATLELSRERGYLLQTHGDGRADIAMPVRSTNGAVVASIVIEATDPEGRARAERRRIARIRATVTELEALVRRRGALATDPFAHVEPEELTLRPEPADE
jgi:DNA-binding IclR family transcriptional regulator